MDSHLTDREIGMSNYKLRMYYFGRQSRLQAFAHEAEAKAYSLEGRKDLEKQYLELSRASHGRADSYFEMSGHKEGSLT